MCDLFITHLATSITSPCSHAFCSFLWPPCVADADIIFFCPVVSYIFFPRLISAVAEWIVYHTSTHVLHAARWKYRMQKIAKNFPSGHHRTTLSGCIFATKTRIDNRNNLLNSNISSTCSQNMANVGPLMAEIGLPVWGTPANFNEFRILASLLQRRGSQEANQTLHDVWPSLGMLHYIHFRGILPLTEFCQVQKFTLRPSLAFFYIGSVTARHSSSERMTNFAAWYKEWNY